MTSNPLKVLVTGPLASQTPLSTFFTKITALNTKHSFSICIALDLFSDIPNDSLELAQLLAGKIEVPLMVYVGVGGGVIPQKVKERMDRGEEVCNNVRVLGKSGLLTLASGLKIATFGGSYEPAAFSAVEEFPVNPLLTPHFTSASLSSFLALLSPPPSNSSIPSAPPSSPDILLTHSLPPSIATLSARPLPANSNPAASASPLDEVAMKVKAKYHFIGGTGTFWEREPFAWAKEGGQNTAQVCRGICLGEMGNKTKARWFYAFSITPHAAPAPLPANVTASPFTLSRSSASIFSGGGSSNRGTKRPAGDGDQGLNEYGVPNYIFGGQGGDRGGKKGRNGAPGPPPEHYTCNICSEKGHWIQDCPNKAEHDSNRPPRPDIRRPIQPDECWFCLSNPKLTKHLIACIGDDAYVTLPKGQLPATSSDGAAGPGCVPGGGHVLIIPIAHYPTLLSIPESVATPILDEVKAYKKALQSCYAVYDCSLMSFEVGRESGKGGHAHVQICPVPNELASKAEEVFRAEGLKQGIEFEIVEALLPQGEGGEKKDYFRVELPGGKVLVHWMKEGGRGFNLQFGRATMATLLNIPERADWKACTKSDKEEKIDTGLFKAAFKAFDPST